MELDDEVAALLMPLEDLDDLALDEALDEATLLDIALSAESSTDERPRTKSSSDASSSTHSSTTASTRRLKHKAPKKVTRSSVYEANSARGQRKREVAYLRQRVAEMEQELELVKSGARPKRFMNQAPPTSPNGTPQPPSVWKEVAARQYEERRQAQLENERLKTDLETQLNVARSLEAILVERATTQSFESCGLGGFTRVFGSAADASDGSVFEALLKSVHETYTNAEWLVRQGGSEADRTQRSSHDARMRATERGLLVEIFATDLLPFTLTETSTAAWQYFSYGKNHLSDPFRYYYERLSEDHLSSEDTVLERSAFELMANGVKAAVRTRQVLRRYVEQDRVVVVWSATMQPLEFDGKAFSGFYLRESGCMVLRRREPTAEGSEGDGDDGPLTVLQSCYFIRPVFQSETGEQHVSTDDADIGKLTECVLSWTAAVIKSWRQSIENILIDNHLNGARKGGNQNNSKSAAAVRPAIGQ